MKRITMIAASLVLVCSAAQAQEYDCLGTTPSLRGVFVDHYSLQTHQGLSELAYRSDTSPDWGIIATYDGNHPKPGDDAQDMTFTHVSKIYHDMPVKVSMGNGWMRVDSAMFSNLCREAK